MKCPFSSNLTSMETVEPTEVTFGPGLHLDVPYFCYKSLATVSQNVRRSIFSSSDCLYRNHEFRRVTSKPHKKLATIIFWLNVGSIVAYILVPSASSTHVVITIYTQIIHAYFFRNLAKKNWGACNIWNKVGTAPPQNKWSRHALKSEVRITC